MQMTNQREVLEMALAGYALKRAGIENEIERVRVMLRLGGSVGPRPVPRKSEKRAGARHMSAAGRARISAASKKRWERYRREKRILEGGRG